MVFLILKVTTLKCTKLYVTQLKFRFLERSLLSLHDFLENNILI